MHVCQGQPDPAAGRIPAHIHVPATSDDRSVDCSASAGGKPATAPSWDCALGACADKGGNDALVREDDRDKATGWEVMPPHRPAPKRYQLRHGTRAEPRPRKQDPAQDVDGGLMKPRCASRGGASHQEELLANEEHFPLGAMSSPIRANAVLSSPQR